MHQILLAIRYLPEPLHFYHYFNLYSDDNENEIIFNFIRICIAKKSNFPNDNDPFLIYKRDLMI